MQKSTDRIKIENLLNPTVESEALKRNISQYGFSNMTEKYVSFGERIQPKHKTIRREINVIYLS